jgi:hypothetical protein
MTKSRVRRVAVLITIWPLFSKGAMALSMKARWPRCNDKPAEFGEVLLRPPFQSRQNCEGIHLVKCHIIVSSFGLRKFLYPAT